MISTTNEFSNYEREQNEIQPSLRIQFNCETGTSDTLIVFTIAEANNFDPEFQEQTYEVVVPTPLPRGLDITYFMTGGGISAKDYDLYGNSLTFETSGNNLFRVEAIEDRSGIKTEFKVRIITTQNILKIDGNETTISITATVSVKHAQGLDTKKFKKNPSN